MTVNEKQESMWPFAIIMIVALVCVTAVVLAIILT